MSYANVIIRLLLVSTLFASPAVAAFISVKSTGNPAVFSVEGSGMDGVAGIQLDITYDADSLANPTVTQGGIVAGAMFASNNPRPGFIKIAIISSRPFSGNGQIAAITFASNTGLGGIPKIASTMIDSTGSAVTATTGTLPVEAAVPGAVVPPEVQFGQPPPPTQAGQPGATPPPTYLGTVTLPTDQQQRADIQPAPAPAPAPYTVEPEPAAAVGAEPVQPYVAPVVDAKVEETLQYVVYKGVIDRFRQYNGSKSLPALAMLFDKKVAQTIHQEPAILLSDGQSRATLTIDIPARITSSPNFAVNGGRLVFFKQDKQSKDRWTVEIQPEAGTVRATVTIIAGAEEFEYPLTVAPPAKTALTLDENGWNRFLKEVGTTAAPLHDLNKDGMRDYMDEYIFVANHLAGKSTPAKPAAPLIKPAQ